MTDSRLDRLERLSRLRESGALTQEEFEREKLRLDMPESGVQPVSSNGQGTGSKSLLIGSMAALAVVAVAASLFMMQNRNQRAVDDAPTAAPVPTVDASSATEADLLSVNPIEDVSPSGDAIPVSQAAGDQPGTVEPNLVGGFYEYRTRIREGWRGNANLAGHYVVIRWGCGTGCTTGVIGNKHTGELHWLELGGEDYPYLQLRFSAGGNTVMANWRNDSHACSAQTFEWDGRRMVALEGRSVVKTVDGDCLP